MLWRAFYIYTTLQSRNFSHTMVALSGTAPGVISYDYSLWLLAPRGVHQLVRMDAATSWRVREAYAAAPHTMLTLLHKHAQAWSQMGVCCWVPSTSSMSERVVFSGVGKESRNGVGDLQQVTCPFSLCSALRIACTSSVSDSHTHLFWICKLLYCC